MKALHRHKAWWLTFVYPWLIAADVLWGGNQAWYDYLDSMGLFIGFLIALRFWWSNWNGKPFNGKWYFLSAAFMASFLVVFSVQTPGFPFVAAGLVVMIHGLIYQEHPYNVWQDRFSFTALIAVVGYHKWHEPSIFLDKGAFNAELFQTNAIVSTMTFGIAVIFTVRGVSIFIRAKREELLQSEDRFKFQDHLFSIIAHNIRSPLSALNNRLEIAKLKNSAVIGTQEVQESLEKILSTVNSMLVEKRKSTIEAKAKLTDILDELERNYPGVDWQIEHIRPESEHKQSLTLALENFISNALKFDRMPLIAVREQPFLEVLIEDSGPGMEEEIFHHFGAPLASRTGGTGMGVYLSLQLLERDGYSAYLGTTPGKGTSIWITNNPKRMKAGRKNHRFFRQLHPLLTDRSQKKGR